MLFLLSPAKSLDYERALPADVAHTLPTFLAQAGVLIEQLRALSAQELGALMDISPALAALNAQRFADWQPDFSAANARQALFAFNGDVYEGLDAYTLGAPDIAWAQEHVVILSGLYGALRPLDWMRPYRLEMGTKLAWAHAGSQGQNLYSFWGSRIAQYLNERLSTQGDAASQVVVHLASQEYFKSVDRKTLRAPVVECVFEDFKGGKYKIISFYAKRARGLMARWAIEQRLTRPEQLQGFDVEGYAYAPEASSAQRLVFRRALAPSALN